MTISNTNTKVIAEGNDLTRNWPFTFPVDNEDFIKVYITDTDDVAVEIFADFEVNLVGSYVTYPTIISGLPLLQVGEKITILRKLPLVQVTDYENQGKFPSASIEANLDNLTKMTQQLQEQLNRAIKFDPSVQSEDEAVAEYINQMNTIKEETEVLRDETEVLRDQVVADAATVAADKIIVAADKVIVAADKLLTEGYKDDAEFYFNTATGISAWIDTKTYTENMMCIHNEVMYYAKDIVGNLNQEPPNTTYWGIPFVLTNHKHDGLDSSADLATLDNKTGHNHNGANSKYVQNNIGRAYGVPLLALSLNLDYFKINKRIDVTVGTAPFGIAFDGSYIWVANSGSNNVSKIDISTDTVVATVTVGNVPRDIAFDGSYIWVVNSGSNNVSKIKI